MGNNTCQIPTRLHLVDRLIFLARTVYMHTVSFKKNPAKIPNVYG